MLVGIDGRPHLGLIDTGSTRSYVFDRSAGTSALLGSDVLFSGSTFGLCFEPARLWRE